MYTGPHQPASQPASKHVSPLPAAVARLLHHPALGSLRGRTGAGIFLSRSSVYRLHRPGFRWMFGSTDHIYIHKEIDMRILTCLDIFIQIPTHTYLRIYVRPYVRMHRGETRQARKNRACGWPSSTLYSYSLSRRSFVHCLETQQAEYHGGKHAG
jgi:hypothetical protein